MSFNRIASAITHLQRELAERKMVLNSIVIDGKYVRETLIGLARTETAITGTEAEAPDDAININGVRILT